MFVRYFFFFFVFLFSLVKSADKVTSEKIETPCINTINLAIGTSTDSFGTVNFSTIGC